MSVSHDIFDTRLMPELYASGQIVGAIIDHEILSHDLRQQARRERDEVFDYLGKGNIMFSEVPKQNWRAGQWKGKRALLYKSYSTLDMAKAMRGGQLTGDCVSWGTRTAIDISRCVRIVLQKMVEEYLLRQATALLYSFRGHTGQGASPARVSKMATQNGILLEKQITDSEGKVWDFTDYKTYVKLGMSYGRSGFPKALLDAILAEGAACKQIALVDDPDELLDGLYNGFGAHCGSSIGVANSGNPVSRLKGSWAHDMGIVGFDDTEVGRAMVKASVGYEDTAVIWDQSWNIWNKVINLPPEWEPWPEGAFALSLKDTMVALRQKDTWLMSDVEGFKGHPIDHSIFG